MDVQQFLNYLLLQRVLTKKQVQTCLKSTPTSLENAFQILSQLGYLSEAQIEKYFQSFQTTFQEKPLSGFNATLVNPQMNLSNPSSSPDMSLPWEAQTESQKSQHPTESASEQTLIDPALKLKLSASQAGNRSVSQMLQTSLIQKNRYQTIETIHLGPTETIQRIQDRWLEREICQKRLVLSGNPQESSETTERFYQEASLTAQLEHPNIVPLYDYRQEKSGSAYFTYRKLNGSTLEEWLSTCTAEHFTENRLISVFLKICDAIAYAHAQSIAHRNLNLKSIQVGSFGEVYVTSWNHAQKINTDLQIQEEVLALGTILQECYRALKEFSEFPLDIQAIIQKSRHSDWKQRYPSVQNLAEDILRYTKNLRLSIRHYGFRELLGKWLRRNRRPFLGILFGVVLILGLSGYGVWSFYQDRQRQFNALWLQLQEEKKQAFAVHSPQSLEKAVHHLLKGLNLCNVAFSLYPQEALIEKEKWELGKKLVAWTCAQENYPLAHSVIQDLESLSTIEEAEKKPLRDYILSEKRKLLTQHLQQLEDWLKRLKSHFRENNLREEALLEISRLKEPEIAERLIGILNEGTRYFLEEKNRTSAQEEFYGVIPCILGRMSHPDIPQTLWDSLELLYKALHPVPEPKRSSSETYYMVLLAQSLAHTQNKKFLIPLFLMRFRMGIESTFSKKTERAYEKLVDLDYLKQLTLVDSEGFSYRGSILLSKHDPIGALADFQEAIRLNPHNQFAYNSLGLAKFHANDFEGALAVFQKLLELNPNNDTAYQNRGNVHFKMGNWNAAIEDWTRMIQILPEAPEGYSNRGNAKRQSGDLQGSLEDYNQALALNAKLPEVYMNRGIVKKEMGDLTGALSDYNQALSFQTQEPIMFLNRGILRLETDDLDGADTDFNQAIRLKPSEAIFYYHRALVKQQQGQKKQALDDLNHSLKLNPNYRHSYLIRGEIKLDSGEMNEALQDFERLIQIDPQYAKAYLKRGFIKSIRKRYKESIEDYTQAIQIDPKMVDAYHNRAVSLINEKQYGDAMNDLNQALQLNPNNSISYFTRGQLHCILNKLSLARTDFQEYLERTKLLQDGSTRTHRQWIEQQFPEFKK